MKLMIVDDSGVVRNRIARVAAARGLSIVGMARNGVTALELFRQERPALVTMDLTMPEMDGVACTREIVGQAPGTIVLVISALADKETAIEALKQGARGFLLKPFTDAQLAEAFAELLEGD